MKEINAIRARVAQACRVLGTLGLTKAATGHISARLPGSNRFFVRARGPQELGVRYTTTDEIVEIDFEGKVVAGKAGLLAPSEVFIHTEIYRARPDVNAVVHIHPPKIVLFTICNKPLRPVFGGYDPSGLLLALAGIPTYQRSIMITTPQLGSDLAGVIGEKRVCLMKGHGITTAHRSVEEAALDAITLNELATINYEAALLGEPDEISEEDREYFRKRSDDGRYSGASDGNPGERAVALWRYYSTLTAPGGSPAGRRNL